ncbi:hypothetical protein IPH25_02985 [bacterium]|nr:MAG: hypothetical protein IPG37_05125 [bacterium]QQR61431.1 MAG: hypothetical protein IPH25_02985 [bacterium]QQR63047.1 MAG: hypothetical protein IPH67_01045 [bacterium]
MIKKHFFIVMIISNTCNLLNAEEMITIATKHDADTIQKQFLKEANSIKKIEKVKNDYFILTAKNKLFQYSIPGKLRLIQKNCTQFTFIKNFSQRTMQTFKTKDNPHRKTTLLHLDSLGISLPAYEAKDALIYINKNRNLKIPIIEFNFVKNKLQKQESTLEKHCDFKVDILRSILINKKPYLFIGSKEKLYLINVPLKNKSLKNGNFTIGQYKDLSTNEKEYHDHLLMESVEILTVPEKTADSTFFITGYFNNIGDYRVVKIVLNFDKKQKKISPQKTLLCSFEKKLITNSSPLFFADYKNKNHWAILGYTKNGYRVCTNRSIKEYINLQFSNKRPKPETIFTIWYDSKKQVHIYCKKNKYIFDNTGKQVSNEPYVFPESTAQNVIISANSIVNHNNKLYLILSEYNNNPLQYLQTYGFKSFFTDYFLPIQTKLHIIDKY